MRGLRKTKLIERRIDAALQAAFDVPVGLAVAHVVDGRRRHRFRQLFLCQRIAERDIRRVGPLHADDVIAGIDMVHLAGDAARHVCIRFEFCDIRLPSLDEIV